MTSTMCDSKVAADFFEVLLEEDSTEVTTLDAADLDRLADIAKGGNLGSPQTQAEMLTLRYKECRTPAQRHPFALVWRLSRWLNGGK